MISSGTKESSTSKDTDPVVCNMNLTISNLVPQRSFCYLNFISVAKLQKFGNETCDAHVLASSKTYRKHNNPKKWIPNPNRKILAILNFHITPMPPIMFKLNQAYPSVADVISRFSRWLPWWPSCTSAQNHFSNSKFSCCPNTFHQVFPSIQHCLGADNN